MQQIKPAILRSVRDIGSGLKSLSLLIIDYSISSDKKLIPIYSFHLTFRITFFIFVIEEKLEADRLSWFNNIINCIEIKFLNTWIEQFQSLLPRAKKCQKYCKYSIGKRLYWACINSIELKKESNYLWDNRLYLSICS